MGHGEPCMSMQLEISASNAENALKSAPKVAGASRAAKKKRERLNKVNGKKTCQTDDSRS